ncbi:hypothetical protein R6Z07F_018904 [Ovis aries]
MRSLVGDLAAAAAAVMGCAEAFLLFVRGHVFSPWSGKISCADEQLSPCATATEPACSRASVCDERVAPAHPARESLHAATKTPRSQKQRQKLGHSVPGVLVP